ncbi:hypothetical protein OE88DRAFT_190081 [Heliocybe sulcata]|uniref:Uncharacterized protein n=1 Tax=Heliocybe sulcata TaxID=5364 RepID=A0A5C3MZH4_9AGAM|nr:hypothetical protein OE88DRAFT_190081 [Heliocybe sulcata]
MTSFRPSQRVPLQASGPWGCLSKATARAPSPMAKSRRAGMTYAEGSNPSKVGDAGALCERLCEPNVLVIDPFSNILQEQSDGTYSSFKRSAASSNSAHPELTGLTRPMASSQASSGSACCRRGSVDFGLRPSRRRRAVRETMQSERPTIRCFLQFSPSGTNRANKTDRLLASFLRICLLPKRERGLWPTTQSTPARCARDYASRTS